MFDALNGLVVSSRILAAVPRPGRIKAPVMRRGYVPPAATTTGISIQAYR